ncbi:unnamed protein product, partial [Discosporangium mesarthrocarpum]
MALEPGKEHRFSLALGNSRSLPMPLRPPCEGRVGQDSDLRLETRGGGGGGGDGGGAPGAELPNPFMFVAAEVSGIWITDFGGLDNGVVFPTLVGGLAIGAGAGEGE